MNTTVFLQLSTMPIAIYTTFCEPVARTLKVSPALPGRRVGSLKPIGKL